MTSVNALRINRDTGILVCDEASYWNEEWMILYTPDKIQSVINMDVVDRYRLAFFVGMSGSTMMGEPIMDRLNQYILNNLPNNVRSYSDNTKLPFGVEELALAAFDIMKDIKADYINDFLMSRYGFSTPELVAGKYERNGKTINIEDEDVQKEAMKCVIGQGHPAEIGYVFRNTLFVAGYSPVEGFRIFFMNTINSVCEEVSEIFVNGGSGTDTNELVYTDFTNRIPIVDRRDGIDIIEGTITAFKAVSTAFRITAGVAPYPNFIHLDGNSKSMVRKIFDHRTQLVAEIVACENRGLLDHQTTRSLIENILFKNMSFFEANKLFLSKVVDKRETELFLRGYSIDRKIKPHPAPMPSSVK